MRGRGRRKAAYSFTPVANSYQLTASSKVSTPLPRRPARNAGAALVWMSVIMLCSGIVGGCAQSQEKYDSHPNAFLVKQLAAKRIVMLGDFYHSAPLPYQTLVSFLNEWVNEVAAGRSNARNVVLVLEDDRQVVKSLNDFISTGNWKPLVGFWLPYNTMEWFEFCSDLRQLHLKIDSLNSSRSAAHARISLSIFGGERFIVFDHPQLLRMSKVQAMKWFVNTRDSLSGHNVIEYLQSHQDKKAIIFYGLGHLVEEYAHKTEDLRYSESGGYYLAYYLKRRFGNDSVLSVAQMPYVKLNHKCWALPIAEHKDVYVPSRELSRDAFVGFPSEIQPGNFDAVITRKEVLIPGHPLGDVFGKTVVEADISRLAFLKKYLPGALAQKYYHETENSLKLITGKDFSDPVRWKLWLREAHYDGFGRIESKALADSIYDEFYTDPQNRALRMEMFGMGIGSMSMNANWIADRTHWKSTFWPEAIKNIKINDAVGLLWVGTPAEKKEAEHFLLKTFGAPLRQPQAYVKLIRQQQFGVHY